ncbi:MAG: polyhydroxyalkanoate synthesis repressor PhaR [Burkholderiales bacterium]|nr:polyhydroxyalkanoate synthesis repressor PhaR [Burkholderiales bacterium]
MSAASKATSASHEAVTGHAPRVLKKYPNRRLYDTRSSSYITLADVKQMVLAGEDFEVRDAKSGEDLTRSILLQIILEEESGGVPIFSSSMLSNIIRFYGHAMQGLMGSMLERNLQAFAEMQQQLVQGQAPLVQGLMGTYLEQSRAMFETMQQQMAQAGAIFPGFTPPKKDR